ncbi:rhotekin 2b isoform X2 [Hoplias malabaricus]
MELRRGQFQLSVFQHSEQDSELQKQIEMEVRVREGACRLLAACSQRDQALEASKSLLTCNSRILALMSQLQRLKEAEALQRTGRRSSAGVSVDERKPCTGKLAISDIRIPLMWKDSEYFKNKGELHRWAVFCLLTAGREIYDTDLVIVDRTHTDICFEDTILFEVCAGFELRLELYTCSVDEEVCLAQAPRRLARLSGSLGRSSGKKLRAALESATACGLNGSSDRQGDGEKVGSPVGSPIHALAQGPKYHLLAHTCLTLSHVQNSFRTHDLTISGTEDSSFWLPLYGSVCCRLVAQPNCMTQQVMSSKLKIQRPGDQSWSEIYCVLKGTELTCYHSQEDEETSEKPAFIIPINKETRIRATENDPVLNAQTILITNQTAEGESTHTLVSHTHEDTHSWMEAFWQHFYDMSQWKQCCNELMKIQVPSPRKPASVPIKQGSLYHEIGTEDHHSWGPDL